MKQDIIKDFIIGWLGGFGGAVIALLGGWTEALTTLVIFMCADYITGLIVALLHNSAKSQSGGIDSKVGFIGLCKKVCFFVAIIVAHRLDITAGTVFIRNAVIVGFISNETISIVENLKLMGITDIEEIFKKALDLIKNGKDTKE